MTVLITLTIAGTDSGPFSLYSNVDGYTTPFETGVPKSLLVAGYTSVLVFTGTTIIQVRSVGTCTNSVNLPVVLLGTSTTTTTTLPTTTTTIPTTSTTTVEPTTTTTTADISCTEVGIDAGTHCPGEEYATVQYTDCEGNVQIIQANTGELPIVCMLNSSTPVYLCGTGGFQYGEACSTTTTTTTIPPTTTTTSSTSTTTSTTTTTTVTPTTTTTTSGLILYEGRISSLSDPINACPLSLVNTVWIEGSSLTSYLTVYMDSGGTIPFNGGDQYWHLQKLSDPNSGSFQIDVNGDIIGPGALCS